MAAHEAKVMLHRKHEHEKEQLVHEHEQRNAAMNHRHRGERHTLHVKHEAEIMGAGAAGNTEAGEGTEGETGTPAEAA